ncbi:hypothetical protein ACTXT7_009248 [Hymenolepis weldensis]
MVIFNESELEEYSILDDPDITLELVLLHPKFNDAYREYDYKLIDYLSQTQNILRMIEFIRRGPDLSKPPDNQYDLACQVEFLFQQDVSSVREAFLSNTSTLDALYSILEDDKASSRLSTLTLTCRIFLTVYQDTLFLQFLAIKPELVSTFLRLVDYDCVRDLFLSFFNIETSSAFALFQGLDKQRLIQRLLKRFLSEETKESSASTDQRIIIGHFLCQIMFVMRQRNQNDDGLTNQPTNPLLVPLERLVTDCSILMKRPFPAVFQEFTFYVSRAKVTNLGEQTIVQVVEAIVTLSSQNSELLPHFLNFLRHLFFTVVQLDIGVSVPSLPNHQTKGGDDFESKGISPRSIGLLHPILPYLKSYLHFEGSAYDAEDNASFSRSCLPLQPLGQVRIHVARFLCHLLFHCRGEDGAEIVERIAELDFVGDLTDLFFAFKWNSLMHATLNFFIQMVFRRGFNYSPIAPSTILNANINNDAPSSRNTSQNCNQQLEEDANSSYKSPNHLNPYAKIVHQVSLYMLLVKHKFLNRLLSAWNLDKSRKGQPGYRRPGYLGHLQEMAVHLSSYLLPDEFDSLGISVRDYDMAIVEDEDRHWQMLQDRRQRQRGEKRRQLENGGKKVRPFAIDELSSDEEDESSKPQVLLRKQLLSDLPPQSCIEFGEFVSGELRQTVSASNVEHLRDLKFTLVSAPNPSRFILTDSALSIEAATEAYNKYKNEPLVRAFNEVFGRDESEFDSRVNHMEERVENMFQDLCTSLVLPEDTDLVTALKLGCGAPLFDQISSTVIRAPDGVEVGDVSAGFPLEFIEDNLEDDFNLTSTRIRNSSPITLHDSKNLHEKEYDSLEQLNREFFSRSRDSLFNIFEEAHREVMLECDDDSLPVSSTASENSEFMEMDFFQPALSLSPVERLRGSSPTLDEGDTERERTDLVRELEKRLSLIPMPTKSDGRPTMSIGRSKRFHQLTDTQSDPSSPLDDQWAPPTSRSLGLLSSPDLPDSDSLVLPRLNSNTFQPRESLPRPIQPTMRSHRLLRTSKNGGTDSNGVSNPFQDPGRRKRLVIPLDFEDGELSIVSADQRLPSQTVDVDAEWTAIDLKRHLSRVYPGKPPVDSQKLIFAGRILTDDSKLRAIIGQEPISKTVHLVLSPSVANQAKAAVAAQDPSGFTPEQMEQLKQQYLQYLIDYHKNDNGIVSNDQNEQEEFDNGDEVINVEVDLGEDFQIPENGFQRVARALGMVDGGGAPQEQGNDVGAAEQVDLFDLAYAVFRISILIAVCFTYASWQRIALVTAVGLIFYWSEEEDGEFLFRLFEHLYAVCFMIENEQP